MTCEPTIRNVCGVILVSHDVERLAAFYRDALGLSLRREEHAGLAAHYGADIGATHFGIHPAKSFGHTSFPSGGSIVALTVDSAEAWHHRLRDAGVETSGICDEGFGPLLRIADPDGNIIELVELTYEFDRDGA